MRTRSNLALLPGWLLGAVAVAATLLGSEASAADLKVAKAAPAAIRARVVELVNIARSNGRRCGSEFFTAAAPLASSPELAEAAASHSRDMAKRRFFEHEGSDGSQPRDRVARAGYRSQLTGENIAYGPESAEEVVAGWLASPGHCANIMEPRFRDIGVGFATGRKRGQIYWVQDFGAPRRADRSRG
jgi:uncharacterized protein YkwD